MRRTWLSYAEALHAAPGVGPCTQEVKLLLALVMRKFRLELETPDMLTRAQLFPYTVPAKGTDGMRLIPREQPLA